MCGGDYLRRTEDELMRDEAQYIRTYTGKKCWPCDPRPEDLDIKDIAHALSLICRFTGHVKQFYCVADHSIRVSDLCSKENKLWGLLHDASEAYLADVARPIKRNPEFGAYYKTVESGLMACVIEKFNLASPEPSEVKTYDNILLRTEQRDLMPLANDGPLEDNNRWKDGVPALPDKLVPRTSKESEELFLQRFQELTAR